MRVHSRIGVVVAAGALTAAGALGGTGIANAQDSLGSLTGSLGADPIEVTFEYAAATGGAAATFSGTASNNTDFQAECYVDAWNAEDLRQFEALVDGGAEYEDIFEDLDPIAYIDYQEKTIDPDSVVDWGFEAEVAEGGTAAVALSCTIDGEDIVVFEYGSTGLFGSLDMGSLGS